MQQVVGSNPVRTPGKFLWLQIDLWPMHNEVISRTYQELSKHLSILDFQQPIGFTERMITSLGHFAWKACTASPWGLRMGRHNSHIYVHAVGYNINVYHRIQ
jgi:hypothetical protein